MADIYKVSVDKANIRTGKDSVSTIIAEKKNNAELKIIAKEVGENNQQYGHVKSPDGWISMSSVSKLGTDKLPTKENTDKYINTTVTGTSESDYDKVLLRSLRAFGAPPRYTKSVDPWYSMNTTTGTGRAMSSTWYSDPSILSLAPGKVDYLPGFSRTRGKNQFFNRIKGAMDGDVLSLAKKDRHKDSGGQLYTFKTDYTKYINIVNTLARTSAQFLGIGDVTDLLEGTNVKLETMDWGWFTDPSGATSGSKGIFSETKRALNAAVNDNAYIHFFVNHSGVQVSESISASSKESWLEEKLGNESGLSNIAENIQFLFGGAIGKEAEEDLLRVVNEARTSNELLGNLGSIATNYIKGGRLVFPKIITGMNYDKSMNVELTFTSIYGDKKSIFRYCIVPCLHLLALATPKQLSSNMYTYPFLVRAFQRGSINMDLAFVSNLDLSRGGGDNTSWTVDGLPTEITARFTITPLYSNLMVSDGSKNPFNFLQNSALMEYLGTMCGIDLHMNNLDRKVEIALNLIKNWWFDPATNYARGLVDSKIANEIRNFTSLLGRY